MNIADTFVSTSKLMGDRTAIIEAASSRNISFFSLNSQSDSYATFLQSEGLKPGERVILMVSPSIDFIALTVALFKLGVTTILIDPGMGFKNLLRCIERVKPQVLIGIPKAVLFARIFRKAFRSVTRYYCCGRTYGFLGCDIRTKNDFTSEPFPVYQPNPDDLAAIIFTTGSTGPPKGVRYEHSIFSAQLAQVKNHYKICDTDIDQPAFPLFALFSTAIGACAVIPDMNPTKPAQVDPQKFVSSIKEHGVTYSFGSPAIWNVVSKYCVQNQLKIDSLQKILMAGAPVPYELLKRTRAILSADAKIFTPYGATESLPIASIESREILDETWAKSKTGKGTCVGYPLPDTEIRIIPISDAPLEEFSSASFLQEGQIGEIIVKGKVVTKSYENNPEETELAKIYDNGTNSFWHRMGDVGYLDAKGRLWFCGRRAHRVKTRSTTMFTICCEAIVNEHPGVFRSALVGITDQTSEISDVQIPVIIIEPVKDKKIDEQKLLDEVRELAGRSQLTAEIEHFLIHRDFPVDIRHNAKIFREKLCIWAENKISIC